MTYVKSWSVKTHLSLVQNSFRAFGGENFGNNLPKDENLSTCDMSGFKLPMFHILGCQH